MIYKIYFLGDIFAKTNLYFYGILCLMTEKELSEMETFFLALADKTRLRLLNLMRGGEICVCFLVEVLKESQPKISRHLAHLRGAGVVEARREGKWIHYKITEPKDASAAQVMRNTLAWLDSQETMQSEYEKLTKIYYSPNNTVTIGRAPKPNKFVESDMKRERKRELETFLL